MHRKLVISFVLLTAAVFLFPGPPALHAAKIGFNPSSGSVENGATFSIDLVISELDNEYVGAFDVDIEFNPLVFDFNSYTLGSYLGDPTNFETLDDSKGLSGNLIDLAEISLLSSDDLEILQNGTSLTLATLSFTAINPGVGDFLLTIGEIGDASGDPLSTSTDSSGRFTVRSGASVVPEPGSLLLMGIGLAGLAGAIRKKFRK